MLSEVQINTSANKIKVQYIPGTAHRKTKKTRRKGGKRKEQNIATQYRSSISNS
jgi:hypothetical protein